MNESGDRMKLLGETYLSFSKVNGKVTHPEITNMLKGSNLDVKPYFDTDTGILNEKGFKTLTEILIQGLNVNIQGAHQQGVIDSAKHLRHIISRLEDLFVMNNDVKFIPVNTVHIDD